MPKQGTILKENKQIKNEHSKIQTLFSPKQAKPRGEILECVAYWGNTVLDIAHFQHGQEGMEKITIGDPTKAHFAAAGKENLTN